MGSLLLRYSTPFIVGLFLVSLVSGIALFFHVGPGGFHGMHEWLSMVLIVPFVLHVWRNWRPMTLYFPKASFGIAMAVSLVAALAFVVMPAGSGRGAGGPPQFALARVLTANPPAKVAPLLGITPEALVATLQAKGFVAAAVDRTLSEIAAQSGKDEMALAAALAP